MARVTLDPWVLGSIPRRPTIGRSGLVAVPSRSILGASQRPSVSVTVSRRPDADTDACAASLRESVRQLDRPVTQPIRAGHGGCGFVSDGTIGATGQGAGAPRVPYRRRADWQEIGLSPAIHRTGSVDTADRSTLHLKAVKEAPDRRIEPRIVVTYRRRGHLDPQPDDAGFDRHAGVEKSPSLKVQL